MDEIIVKSLIVGQLATNCYLIADRKSQEAIIVDPGDGVEYIENTIRDLEVNPTQVVATHGHFDHILGAWELQNAYNIPFLISEKDAFLVERMQKTAQHFLGYDVVERPPEIGGNIKNGEVINLGEHKIEVIATPGHTPGSICLLSKPDKWMLTGDTLFASGAVGRTDFSYASRAELTNSLGKILSYPDEMILYPGHGEVTSVIIERQIHNENNTGRMM